MRIHISGIRASVAGCAIAACAVALLFFSLPAAAAPLRTVTAFSPFDATGIGVAQHLFGTNAVAVDESSGNVFLPTQRPDNTVYVLNSEGGIPSGVAAPYEVGDFHLDFETSSVAVDNSATSPSKGAVYVADPGGLSVKKFVLNVASEAYEPAGQLIVASGGQSKDVTVDEEGNVFVSEPFGGPTAQGVITKFSPSGLQLEQIQMTAATANPQGLAVDSAGDLFVQTGSSKAFKFPVNGLGELDASNFAAVSSEHQIFGIGIDRATNTLFASLDGGQFYEVVEYDAASLVEQGNFGRGPLQTPHGVAVNEAGGLLYVAQGESIGAYQLAGPMLADAGTTAPSEVTATKATLNGMVGPEGIAVGECKFKAKGTELPCEGATPADNGDHPVTAQLTGLTPNTSYSYRLLVTNANGTVETQNKFLRTEPIAKTTPATAVTPAGATLNGVVRPEGTPIGECKFEYGLTTEYEASLPCSPEAGAIPPDFEPHAVSADLSGLLVGTTYHFRLVASSGLGSEKGEDATFTTLGPSVDRLFFSRLTENSVRLEALVNPRGKDTAYHFEYGSEGPCATNPCTSIPIPDASAGADNKDTNVSQEVKGLAPDTTYHFRIVVSNADGPGQSNESTFTTYQAPGGLPPCPDETFRAGKPSAKLPDCRVYEQASPVEKNGNDISGGILFKVQASISGDGITSQTYGGVPGAEGSEVYPSYLSQRGPQGWSTQGLLPPPTYGEPVQMMAWTPDLAYSFARVGQIGSDAAGEVANALLVRSSATHEIKQVTPYLDGAKYAYAGSSADDSKLFIEAKGSTVNLTGNARVGKDNLYLYEPATEELSLIGVLPNGTAPPGGSFAGPYDWFSGGAFGGTPHLQQGGALGLESQFTGSMGYFLQRMNAVSTDGSKAFFTAGETGQIYVREGIGGESPETRHVSASQRLIPDPNGQKPAVFAGATPEGEVAFFISCEKLTEDSTAVSTASQRCDTPDQGRDLYSYSTADQQLSDLTVDTNPADPHGADVIGFLGSSDDGSFVYFVANGDLDGAGPAEPGDCQSQDSGGSISYTGSCNVYVRHEGSSTFVAKLEASKDFVDWEPRPEKFQDATLPSSSVSSDGRTFVFSSVRSLTGYDNITHNPKSRGCESGCGELFRYRFGGHVACVSCNPTGAPPVSAVSLDTFELTALFAFPANHPFAKRFVSESGNQVFFESADKLVAADVNGDDGCASGTTVREGAHLSACQDVYEWEAAGAGSCSEASPTFSSQSAGCLYLLSTGTSPTPSYFGDASASGEDVFIFTRSQLVPSDKDGQTDIYDARVGGGLASQNEPPPPPPCEGAACRGGTPPPPSGPSAGSSSFSGPGDPVLKRHHKKHHHKNRHHGKHKKRHHKRAGANQGGSK